MLYGLTVGKVILLNAEGAKRYLCNISAGEGTRETRQAVGAFDTSCDGYV
jgi:hypothetical protein